MKTENYIFLIIGPSGSGKTTVANILEKEYGCSAVASYTTRPPRYEGEKGHIFVSQEEFDRMRINLVAYTNYGGYEYGVTTKEIDENDIYVIDIPGVRSLMTRYHGKKELVKIGLAVPMTIRSWRMELRGDRPEDILKRLELDEIAFPAEEFNTIDKLDNGHIFKNMDSEKTAKEIAELIDFYASFGSEL